MNRPPGVDDDEPLFHLALPDEWAEAFAHGEYRRSTRGRSLEDEGFVHASTLAQVEGVANRFYADLDELVLLTIDPERVPYEIRWEPPAPGVEELFPHVYGPVPIDAVVTARLWRRSGDGGADDDTGEWSLDDVDGLRHR